MNTITPTDESAPHSEAKLQKRLVTCLQHEGFRKSLPPDLLQVAPDLLLDLELPEGHPSRLVLQFDNITEIRASRGVENSQNYFDTSLGYNRIVLNRWQMLGTSDSRRYSKMEDMKFVPMAISLLSIYRQNIHHQYRSIDIARRLERCEFIRSSALPAARL